MTPTALEIIKQYLINNDYDGLTKHIDPISNHHCGCDLQNFQPCGDDFSQCKPGYKYKDPTEEYTFLIIEELQEGMKRIK